MADRVRSFTPGSDSGLATWAANPDNGNSVTNPTVSNATWTNELIRDERWVSWMSSLVNALHSSIFRPLMNRSDLHLPLPTMSRLLSIASSAQRPLLISTEVTKASYTAVETTEGVWQLMWNDTAGSNIDLRRNKPNDSDSSQKIKVKRAHEIMIWTLYRLFRDSSSRVTLSTNGNKILTKDRRLGGFVGEKVLSLLYHLMYLHSTAVPVDLPDSQRPTQGTVAARR